MPSLMELVGEPGAAPGVVVDDEVLDYDALLNVSANGSLPRNASLQEDVVFDRTDVRALFIVLYTLVFCCCFFGNLLVIIVVTLSRRLRSITNFFLANLAVADLCVGVFCVYQNLTIYLVQSWVLGDLVCKLYHFVHSLSYTASIFILVVICTERYFAIIHPITCKQILTPRRLRVVMLCVWVLSALYSSPRFFWVQTISMPVDRIGNSETICISHRQKYDSETFDLINFGLLYATPLAVMLLLYTRIALVLWDAGRGPPGIHSSHRPRKEVLPPRTPPPHHEVPAAAARRGGGDGRRPRRARRLHPETQERRRRRSRARRGSSFGLAGRRGVRR